MNKGIVKEKEAKEHLLKLYDIVKSTQHSEFYDYLCSKKKIDTLIEVKSYIIPYENGSGYIIFGENQFNKLIKSGNFLVYFMTNKGNIFVSPEQIVNYGHVHYNKLNPSLISYIVRVKNTEDGLKVIEPTYCKFCKGKIKDIIKEGNKL